MAMDPKPEHTATGPACNDGAVSVRNKNKKMRNSSASRIVRATLAGLHPIPDNEVRMCVFGRMVLAPSCGGAVKSGLFNTQQWAYPRVQVHA